MLPIAFYDTECFPNYWLLKIRPRDNLPITFSLRAGESFDAQGVDGIRWLFNRFTLVSFNGNYYDVPMICAALQGYTCEQLKWLNDQIILEGRKPWELGLPEWKPADHIDITEVLPGTGSQKMYAGRIHCKLMRDLPYSPDQHLSPDQIAQVDSYCENDLTVLEDLFNACGPMLQQREELSKRYGIDLRSKSDAQLAEAVLKRRCEQALGQRIYKPEIDWNLTFRYEPPEWLSFKLPSLQKAFEDIKSAWFMLGPTGAVVMPKELEGLEIQVEHSSYRLGIGGLHSSEKCRVYRSTETHVLRDVDVASYYPSLILNSGKWPAALGPAFLREFAAIKKDRLEAKEREKTLTKAGFKGTPEWLQARSENEGGKIMINGTFGKTGSPYSILFAPEMMIQTTVTGQLALLMLIEWHEQQGIPVVSANTDGLVMNCPRTALPASDALIEIWQERTGLEMEAGEYQALYSRDVNNYFAVKPDGEVKRKGAYSKADLIGKKSPDVEICGDAVADFLANGTPILYTLAACLDIRKFLVVQKVAGGGVKLWGEGPRKGMLVRDMSATLEAHGWEKKNRGKWVRWSDPFGAEYAAHDAYRACFTPQRPEYLGKCIRFYYAVDSPGPIIYQNGNLVGNSYGAKPLMALPDEFPADVDYAWYLETCQGILRDIGFTEVPSPPR